MMAKSIQKRAVADMVRLLPFNPLPWSGERFVSSPWDPATVGRVLLNDRHPGAMTVKVTLYQPRLRFMDLGYLPHE